MTTQSTHDRLFILRRSGILVLVLAMIAGLGTQLLWAQSDKISAARREVVSADKLIQVEANLVPAEPAISDEPVLTLTVRH
ncbi:MAG: hypothetical protein Q4G59_03260, partial [Planctomycetia bacterium]|nr:hypothetical protein [Planctomycetia bacterium]